MNKIFLQQIKQVLLNQKRDLLIKSSQNIEIDNDGDETDEIQANMLLSVASQLNNRDNYKLRQISDALQRIEDLTYGICQDCEISIPEKRLLVNPYFLSCVNCAEKREIEEKQRKRE